ncbi:hypothetical protein OG953_09165 [Streptomyces sp. NBC_00057]
MSTGTTAYWDSYTFDIIGNRVSMAEHNPADPTKVTTLAYGYGTGHRKRNRPGVRDPAAHADRCHLHPGGQGCGLHQRRGRQHHTP